MLYVNPKIRDGMSISQYGWHMVKHRGDYTRNTWEIATDATRFECGSPNMLGIHALNASLSLIEEVGIEQISNALANNINYLIEGLKTVPNATVLSSTEQSKLAGIVTFKVDGIASEELYSKLMKEKVICACRGGGVRFSPHFYTDRGVIDSAIEKVKEIISE